MSPLFELPELFETQQKETLKDVRALGEVGHFENGANVFFLVLFQYVATFVKGHILQDGCKNMFRAQFPSGTHKCL